MSLVDKMPSDAPVWLSAEAAEGWAQGWNAAAEVTRQGWRKYVNRRSHACGCHTAFDLGAWESVGIVRCPAHTRPSLSVPTAVEPAPSLPDAKGHPSAEPLLPDPLNRPNSSKGAGAVSERTPHTDATDELDAVLTGIRIVLDKPDAAVDRATLERWSRQAGRALLYLTEHAPPDAPGPYPSSAIPSDGA